jgi:hypothetical protein
MPIDRKKAALGQPALQRHLPTFKSHLVESAGARLLTFMATARCLAQAATDPAAHTTP